MAHMGRIQSPEARLSELGIELPEAPPSLGDHPAVQLVGDMLYTTAVLPVWNGQLIHTGAVGTKASLADGIAAARLCGVNLLALVRASTGSLDSVQQIVQVIGLVNCAPNFAQPSKVLNGLSELLYEVFGEAGRHSRTAVATTDLPQHATVQATAVVRVDPARLRMPAAAEVAMVAVESADAEGAMPVAGAPVERTAHRVED